MECSNQFGVPRAIIAESPGSDTRLPLCVLFRPLASYIVQTLKLPFFNFLFFPY